MTRLLLPLAILAALAVLLGCTADPPFQHDARPGKATLVAYHADLAALPRFTVLRDPAVRPHKPLARATAPTAPDTPTMSPTHRHAQPNIEYPVRIASSGATIACVVNRESGGQPQVWNRPHTNWGIFQFDLPTWVTYGGTRAEFGNASAAEQWAVFGRAVAAGDLYHGWLEWDGCK